MTRPRPDDRSLPVAARHRCPADDDAGLETDARVADALARTFGILAVLGALAAAFGGWFATLR